MHLTYPVIWHQPDVIPPRCRTPRTIRHDLEVTLEVPEVSAQAAPIAFEATGWPHQPPQPIRWWQQRTWQPHLPWARQTEPTRPGSAQFPHRYPRPLRLHAATESAALAAVAAHHAGYLIIDGVVWETTGEPRYQLYALGLGHNHSGSGITVAYRYNPNIGASWYFRADAWPPARAAAVALCRRRGDTDSMPAVPHDPLIVVHLPAAVRCQPARDHGDGDAFLNGLHTLTESAPDAATAAWAALGHLARHLHR